MKIAFVLALSAAVAGVSAPSFAQSGRSDNAHQAALDKKFGVAPAGRWWDDNGRLCHTEHASGKSVRRCEDPAKPSDTHQKQLAAKYGPAPDGTWWDDAGRLCHSRGPSKTRVCEKPTAHR
ncbi:hypothetical protein SAMN05192583_2118 [Sphingomonas gellani]|uniref:Uncharacterized protein n=1 Tax=Sphingomonas gellani TaxID=1166340 RepID=A0A1H8EBQ1_9SPHN|nr:hypothetical protein [Sphingomonas gellani]SEN16800.1 hypothetical protein SAMN05192583_2118 [Sphingomonas gellani]